MFSGTRLILLFDRVEGLAQICRAIILSSLDIVSDHGIHDLADDDGSD
jgi:hypothetical protein